MPPLPFQSDRNLTHSLSPSLIPEGRAQCPMSVQRIRSPVILERITSLIQEITASKTLLPLLPAISNKSSVCCSAPAVPWLQSPAPWSYDSNCRMQIFAHTIKILSLSLSLSLSLISPPFFSPSPPFLTPCPLSFPFVSPVFLTLSASFPF